MVVGEIATHADLVVIGGGPGGYVAALRAAELGRDVVLVERGGMEGGLGGACLHVGCIPSKGLIELAETRERIGAMGAAGLRVEALTVDLGAFQSWKDALVGRLRDGVEGLLERAGVRVVEGTARFSGPDRVVVELNAGVAEFIEFEHAIVATGSRPTELPGLKPDGERVITSTGALALDRLPDRLTIIGAGYVGLELGMAFAKLGTKVRVVEALDRILESFDGALTVPVLRRASEIGIELHTGTQAIGLTEEGLQVEGPDGSVVLGADHVVVAVGRTPNTEELRLDAAGITVSDGGMIDVDERRFASERIAAIGDVTTGPALAHKASAEGVVAAEATCGMPSAFDPMAVPVIAFTDPELASTGMTESEAREAGLDVAVGTAALAGNGRAATIGATRGFAQVVVDRGTDRVVGAHVAAPHASELIAAGTLAVEMIASPVDLVRTIHPHPTLSEIIHAAASTVAAAAAEHPQPTEEAQVAGK